MSLQIFVVKSAKGDIPSDGTATVGGIVATEAGAGQVSAKPDELRQTPVSRIVGINIPGTVFGPGGKIAYVDEGGELGSSRTGREDRVCR